MPQLEAVQPTREIIRPQRKSLEKIRLITRAVVYNILTAECRTGPAPRPFPGYRK